MDKKIKLIGIGIATMDVYCHQGRMYPGGNEYNIAYNAKLLGAETGFMGVFANDKAGRLLEQTLTEAGIDTHYSHHEKGSSGYALVDLKDGDRIFLDWNKQGVTDLYPLTFTQEEIAYIQTFDIACTSWGGRVSKESIRRLAKAGISICYDFYDNFTESDIREIGPYITYAFFSSSHISKDEAKAALKTAVELGCEIAVGTRGSKPAIAYDGTRYYEQDACKVTATDTMGAGDAYISAFLVKYLSLGSKGRDGGEDRIEAALKNAAVFAAAVVAKDGALGVGYDIDIQKLSEIINV